MPSLVCQLFNVFLHQIKTEPRASIKQEKEEATWSVLRDDFMPQAKMRDWDKQSSSDSDDS